MGRSRRGRCTAWSRIDWGSMRSTYASLATSRTPRLSPPMRGSAGQRTPRGDLSDLEGAQRAEDRAWAVVTEGPSYNTPKLRIRVQSAGARCGSRRTERKPKPVPRQEHENPGDQGP